MRKNFREVNPIFTIKRAGNWNFRNKDLESVFTKPIGLLKIGEDDISWKHEEILKLIELFHKVDEESIKMIQNEDENTGAINNFETPFLTKIKNFIITLEYDKK